MKINDDGDKNDAQAKLDAEIADLSDFDDAEADMSDAENHRSVRLARGF
jgi:hypothetical protein